MTYEFGSHAAGQILTITGGATLNGDQVALTSITHPDTAFTTDTPSANHSGLYRDPLPLSDGTVIAVHTASTQVDTNIGTGASPVSRYDFRLKTLTTLPNGYQGPGQLLTPGITKTISYWDPDQKVTYTNVQMWELNPVEVRARTRPARRTTPLPAPEQAVFAKAGVDPAQFKAYLAQRNLAVLVSRNVTTRDDADHQQPFNLRVAGTSTQTIGAPGKIYDVANIQFFQGDQLRGLGLVTSSDTPRDGRRVLAEPLHDPAAALLNPLPTGAAAGSVAIAGDGSMAAFVPARRAMTWQLTDQNGLPVVRERLWVTFQPGEVRVCASCHGINQLDQAGHAPPANQPKALEQLLLTWKLQQTGRKVYLPAVRR
jgi:Hydrazine synthase alpha subunit middle domain